MVSLIINDARNSNSDTVTMSKLTTFTGQMDIEYMPVHAIKLIQNCMGMFQADSTVISCTYMWLQQRRLENQATKSCSFMDAYSSACILSALRCNCCLQIQHDSLDRDLHQTKFMRAILQHIYDCGGYCPNCKRCDYYSSKPNEVGTRHLAPLMQNGRQVTRCFHEWLLVSRASPIHLLHSRLSEVAVILYVSSSATALSAIRSDCCSLCLPSLNAPAAAAGPFVIPIDCSHCHEVCKTLNVRSGCYLASCL